MTTRQQSPEKESQKDGRRSNKQKPHKSLNRRRKRNLLTHQHSSETKSQIISICLMTPTRVSKIQRKSRIIACQAISRLICPVLQNLMYWSKRIGHTQIRLLGKGHPVTTFHSQHLRVFWLMVDLYTARRTGLTKFRNLIRR